MPPSEAARCSFLEERRASAIVRGADDRRNAGRTDDHLEHRRDLLIECGLPVPRRALDHLLQCGCSDSFGRRHIADVGLAEEWHPVPFAVRDERDRPVHDLPQGRGFPRFQLRDFA